MAWLNWEGTLGSFTAQRKCAKGLEQVLRVTDVPELSVVAENLGALTLMTSPCRLSVTPLARSSLLLDTGAATLVTQGKTS